MGKKILFLANHFITLYSFRRKLIERLIQGGNEVYLSLPEDPDNKYFEDLGCKIIITKIDRRGVNPLKDIKLICNYKIIIKKIDPDIIFSYTVKPNIYGSLAHGKKYKQICNITGLGGVFLKENFLSKLVKFLYRISVKNAYKVFFQNQGDLDFFVKNNMVRENYELIPGSGCDLSENTYLPMPDDSIIRFMFVGRIMEIKGVDNYLNAAKAVKIKYPNTEFIIAGWLEQKEYKKAIDEYQNSGYIKYIGFRKDIKDWIEKVHCVVLPSIGGEGIPNVLLESAATGRACIGSKISGTVDVIEDGVTGFLFETGNTDDLIDKLEKFINLTNDEKTYMGFKGREKVEREFDREMVINRYLEEVNNIYRLSR